MCFIMLTSGWIVCPVADTNYHIKVKKIRAQSGQMGVLIERKKSSILSLHWGPVYNITL